MLVEEHSLLRDSFAGRSWREMENTMAKTAIVTGASGGIGRAIAERLAKDGFAVAVHYSGNIDRAQEVVDSIAKNGGHAVAVRGDVAQAEDVKEIFANTISALGSVDVVVHTAGIMPLFKIEQEDMDAFDKVIATNLRGTFLVMAEAAKQVRDNGRVIVFSSSVLAKSFPTYGAYIASKAGVEGLVKVLANEIGSRHITVNAIAPGPVATPLFLKGKTDQAIAELGKLAPLGRIGQPEDIAGVVSFLAGNDGAWVNGQVIRANGGFA